MFFRPGNEGSLLGGRTKHFDVAGLRFPGLQGASERCPIGSWHSTNGREAQKLVGLRSKVEDVEVLAAAKLEGASAAT